MRAYVRDTKIANKPSAYDDFITLCSHFGFVQCKNKDQAMANLRIKDWQLPDDAIQNTKLYKQLIKLKGTPQECGSSPEEWRAITVLNAFMPAAIHIISNIPDSRREHCRISFSVFHYRLLPAEAGRALIADKFFNPINHSDEDWIYARLYFLWSSYFSGKKECILTDALRVFIAVYVAAYVSEDLALKIFSYAIHVIKSTPIGDMNFSRATLHVISDVLTPDGDGSFPAADLRGATLSQLSVKGIKFPSYKRLSNYDNWTLKETFLYGWNLAEFADNDTKLYQDVLAKDTYSSYDKTDARKCCDHCRYMFERDIAFVNGTLAAYERVIHTRDTSFTEKERSIERQYEEKFKTMNSRLSEKTAEHQETMHSLDKAERRIKELEGMLAEKDKQLTSSELGKLKRRNMELEKINNDLSSRLSGAQNRISTLEGRESTEQVLTERIKQLESDCEFYQKMLSIEEDEDLGSNELTAEEIEQLKGIRAHLIFPELKSLRNLSSLLPASRITFNQADHRVCVDVPKNMEMYVFCTRIAGHSDWDTWKGKTKKYADRRVYCPYTGITAICRFLLQQYALIHK